MPKKKTSLAKELTVILSIKAVVILLIWWLFFSHSASEHINNNKVFVDHILTTQKDTTHDSIT
jgi:hypothetical protein